jgi:hypothetical protein
MSQLARVSDGDPWRGALRRGSRNRTLAETSMAWLRPFLGLVLVALMILIPAESSSGRVKATLCERSWTVPLHLARQVRRGPGSSPHADFLGVAAPSNDDVWAVGYLVKYSREGHAQGIDYPLIEHWDGTRWTMLVGKRPGMLLSVASVSRTSVWAVGSQASRSFIEHFNGHGWSTVAAPRFGDALIDLAVRSATNIWVVAEAKMNGVNLVERWDGRSWTVLRLPGRNPDAYVVGLLGDTLWAAGSGIARWNGRGWATITTVPGQNLASGISGTSRVEGWLVSDTDPVIVHWNGHRWTRIGAPRALVRPQFTSVADVAADAAWIVGSASGHALAMRWDGRDWTVVPTTGVGTELDAVAVTSSGDVWATGSAGRYGVVARYSCS